MLSKKNIEDELIQILQSEFELYSFKIEDIDLEQSIFSLGMDSVDMMILITILEEKYEISIQSDNYDSFLTINSIIDSIYRLVEEK